MPGRNSLKSNRLCVNSTSIDCYVLVDWRNTTTEYRYGGANLQSQLLLGLGGNGEFEVSLRKERKKERKKERERERERGKEREKERKKEKKREKGRKEGRKKKKRKDKTR